MRPAVVTALLGLVLTLTAATFDAEPLYVAGIGLMVLAGVTSLWVVLVAREVRLTRTVGARRTIEEEPVVIDLIVSGGRLPLPSGYIEDDLLPKPAAMVSGRRRTEVHISARVARRGRKVLAPPRIVVSDPLGLATRVVSAEESAELLVLPRLQKVVTPPGEGDGSGLVARRGRPSIAAEVDLDGLRPYRPGAAASRIFWPGLARGGELMERRLRSDGDTRPLIVLDPRAPASSDALDAAVRATGSLVVHFAKRTGCGLLMPGDRRATIIEHDMLAWPSVHVRLALLDDHTGPSLAAAQNRRGLIVYVAARPVDRAPRGLGRTPGGCLLVMPGALPNRRAVLEVAGCYGYISGRQSGAAAVAALGSAA